MLFFWLPFFTGIQQIYRPNTKGIQKSKLSKALEYKASKNWIVTSMNPVYARVCPMEIWLLTERYRQLKRCYGGMWMTDTKNASSIRILHKGTRRSILRLDMSFRMLSYAASGDFVFFAFFVVSYDCIKVGRVFSIFPAMASFIMSWKAGRCSMFVPLKPSSEYHSYPVLLGG